MRRHVDPSEYEIKSNYTEADFKAEKEILKKDLSSAFKKSRRNFLCLLVIALAAFGTAFYMIYFQNALFDHPFVILILCVVLAPSLALLAVEYKTFKKEEMRYRFRVNSLLERVTNDNLFLSVPEDEIKKDIKTAYLKYGISVKALLAIILAFLIVFYGIVPAVNKSKIKFSPEKWQVVEKRQVIYGSLKDLIENYSSDKKEYKVENCDFSDQSLDNFLSILGEPEVKNDIYRGKNTESKTAFYRTEMGETINIYYDSSSDISTEMTVLQYYSGKNNRGLKQWILLGFVDGQYVGIRLFRQDKYGQYEDFSMSQYVTGSTDYASR